MSRSFTDFVRVKFPPRDIRSQLWKFGRHRSKASISPPVSLNVTACFAAFRDAPRPSPAIAARPRVPSLHLKYDGIRDRTAQCHALHRQHLGTVWAGMCRRRPPHVTCGTCVRAQNSRSRSSCRLARGNRQDTPDRRERVLENPCAIDPLHSRGSKVPFPFFITLATSPTLSFHHGAP